METGTFVSLAAYFVVMLGIGVYAYRKSTSDVHAYMLGGRSLSPKVTALSAGASDMSGWMLMGVPGAMFVSGLSSVWIAVGLVIGAFLNYLLVAPRLRTYTELAGNAITIPDYFENRFQDTSRLLRVISSVVIIVFFTLYTSSGVVAGGKLFESSFGLNYELGLYITAGVVVAYTLFGGFLAVSLTDFVQGCIMFVSLVLVPVVVLMTVGADTSFALLTEQPYSLLALFVDASTGDTLTFVGITSLMAWGLGYFGQPHIIVRFMAIRDVRELPVARRIGMSWMIISLLGAMATGLFGYAYVKQQSVAMADPETIFIYLSQVLFHPLIAGFLLAAILAAIMSTISSQLLVTSSSLTSDVYQAFVRRDATQRELVAVGRVSVFAVALVAVLLAYDRQSTILSLVSNAWAGFGSAFGPVILFSLFWKRMTRAAAISGILVGAITVLCWIYIPVNDNGATLSQWMYEIVPGFILCSMTIVIVSRLSPVPEAQVTDAFEQVERTIKQTKADANEQK